MYSEKRQLIYWLFFCTNEIKGLEVMKRAMLKVDTSGGHFSFCDATNPDQLIMFDQCTDEWLAEHLSTKFAGQDLTVAQIEEHVLTSTPRISFKTALKTLEDSGRLMVLSSPDGRRKGTFPAPEMLLHFLKNPT